tara:strand:+ start:1936 stop:2451 length:516 start_codon:yes stop_codon:yes gene_type:complete
MICTNFDGHMNKLCHQELMISWQITLTDGTLVFGDYDRPETDNPWNRLKQYCSENDVLPAKVELYMFGAEHKVFFEDPNGLDGIAVFRGIAKEQTMDGNHSQSFQTLTVLLLNDSCDYIDVSKYTWPNNQFEQKESVRGLSTKNLEHMIFRDGSEKLKHKEVQEYLNLSAV